MELLRRFLTVRNVSRIFCRLSMLGEFGKIVLESTDWPAKSGYCGRVEPGPTNFFVNMNTFENNPLVDESFKYEMSWRSMMEGPPPRFLA